MHSGKDVIPGATSDDAGKLKDLLDDDPRVKDTMVKVFPDLDHGFAHIGLSERSNADADTELVADAPKTNISKEPEFPLIKDVPNSADARPAKFAADSYV